MPILEEIEHRINFVDHLYKRLQPAKDPNLITRSFSHLHMRLGSEPERHLRQIMTSIGG